jgi:hypothetical protein
VNIRQRLEAFWRGEKPDRIPFTAYRRFFIDVADTPEFQALVRQGFGLTWNIPAYQIADKDVQSLTQKETGGRERRTLCTPVGDIFETYRDGWHEKYLIETADDYRVMQWIIERRAIEPAYDAFGEQTWQLPDWIVPLNYIDRSPLQKILVDFVGLENFGLHLFEHKAELLDLYAALRRSFRRMVEIAAAGPCTYVSCLENFTAESLGPQRYAELLLPVYEECFPMLRQAGKVVGCHYDGRTLAVRDQIRDAPIDVLEALTPPPEGDQTLGEARAAWPAKLFWSNINLEAYERPAAELKQYVLDLIAQAAPDGRSLALEISENTPASWKRALPVVFEAISEATL